MPLTTRRQHNGAAIQTTLTQGVGTTDLTMNISSSQGWPDGSVGPFFCVLDRGQATEEKVLVTSRTAQTLTLPTGGRGVDGTAPATHSTGSAIYPVFTALEADESNLHTSSAGNVHGIAGNVVGDSDAQTLTNKTLTQPTINGTVAGGATYSSPTLTTPTVNGATINGTVAGGATYTAPTLTTPTLNNPTITGTLAATNANLTTPTLASPNITGTATVAAGAIPESGVASLQSDLTARVKVLGLGSALVNTPPPSPSTGQFMIQASTDVLTMTSGGGTLAFPTTFPGGVVTVTATVTNASASPGPTFCLSTVTTSQFSFFLYAQASNSTYVQITSGSWRINWIAVGW